jgi:hypothetical protein
MIILATRMTGRASPAWAAPFYRNDLQLCSMAAMQCENHNQMLLKANQAMKILHYKLQKERKTVARLQASFGFPYCCLASCQWHSYFHPSYCEMFLFDPSALASS